MLLVIRLAFHFVRVKKMFVKGVSMEAVIESVIELVIESCC